MYKNRRQFPSFLLYFFSFLILFNFCLNLSAAEFSPEELSWIGENSVLEIGTIESGPPFFFESSHGELTGLAVKIVEELSKISGIDFKFVFYDTVEDLFAASDELVFGVSTDYQLNDYTLSSPFLEAETVLFYRQGLNPAELNDKRFALVAGSVLPEDIDEDLLVFVANREESLLAVEQNKADYGYGNSYSIAYYNMKAKYKNLALAPISELKRAYSFGLKSDANPHLLAVLNKSIEKLDPVRMQSIIMAVTSEVMGSYAFDLFMRDNWRLVAIATNLIILVLFLAAFYIWVINRRLKREIVNAQIREEEIRYLNFYDVLTGLPNRRYYEEALVAMDIKENLPLSIIVGDLNGLKISNDAFGHEEGDNLIQRAAKLFKENCLDACSAFRLGGDEFIMLLPQTRAKRAAELMAEMERQSDLDLDGKIPLKISLGYATKTREIQSLFGIIKLAEDMMYKEKMRTSQKIKNGIIADLLEQMFEKGIESKENIEKTKELATALANNLNLFDQDVKDLLMLVDIHDIGKIAVSEEILFKEGPLSPPELAEMHSHIEVGFRIADASNIYSPVAKFILTIREHYDGSGYPQGLRGDEIPLISRIFQIVDAYVQMTSDRPYKQAMSANEAKAELLSLSGKHYDPQLLSTFITLV